MKNNFDKALSRKTTNRKPWYIIKTEKWNCPIWFVFLIPIAIVEEALKNWAYNRRKWSTKKANKILRYAFPRKAEVNHEEQTIGRYLRSFWFTWETFAKWYDKKWCRKFNRELMKYCIEEFEMEGYTKIVEVEDSEWTWVAFKKN